MPPPNILYLHSHDAGRYAEPYGFAIPAPNLMRFAREGVLFRQAYAAAPTCGPSRASLLTGQYPHQCGMYGLPGQGWSLAEPSRHLVQVLNGLGYETALAGVQHEIDHANVRALGYRRCLDERSPSERGLGEFGPRSIEHVEAYLAEKSRQCAPAPFFLSAGIDEPHRNNGGCPSLGIGDQGEIFSHTEYYDPNKLDARYVAPPPFLPDTPEIRRDMASYIEGVRLMDRYMGRVLRALDHRGFGENTLVIVTTDHGIEFPGGKKTLTDQGIGVMLLIRGPGGFEGSKVVDSLVSQIDLYPTILEAIEAGPRPWLEGRPIQPLVRSEAADIRDAVFAEQTYHGKPEPMRCVRTGRYKYIQRLEPTSHRLRYDGPSGAWAETAGFHDRPAATEELFDLHLDPMEARNRAEDPAYREKRENLKSRLEAWMKKTSDRFRDGQVPPVPKPG